jgi:hypothetical protein
MGVQFMMDIVFFHMTNGAVNAAEAAPASSSILLLSTEKAFFTQCCLSLQFELGPL